MDKSAVILAAGEFPRKPFPLYLLASADYIVCCDSALGRFLGKSLSIFGTMRLPDAVVGDIDSLSPTLRKRYASLIVHIPEQETNDLTKAMNYVTSHFEGVTKIHILGATGKREDHTVGNMGLLMEYLKLFPEVEIDLVSDYSTMFAIKNSCTLVVGTGRSVSIFSPDNALKIKSSGLEYPTDNVVFNNWWPATLNKASKDEITLTLSHPSMVLIVLN